MKYAIVLATTLFALTAAADTETRKVCVDVKDKAGLTVKDKAGKAKQTCKTMKKHEKLQGTPVPEKK
jgi:hypothetical protein